MMFQALSDLIKGKPKSKRSSKWPLVRYIYLKSNPLCASCGGRENLEVHHKIPVHIRPDLELEKSNLITLCESKHYGINCHLFVGHCGNYKEYNNNIDKGVNLIKYILNSKAVR
jgi:5-methylcytosine-specific restriction enzyme A